MRKIEFQLYLVTDRKQVRDQALVPALVEALEGGVRAVQLREKDLSDRQIYELGCTLRTVTRDHDALLLINDRADIALAVDADGVHLTQTSYGAKEARRIVGRGRLIGVSTHSLPQAEEAEADGADFITLGPTFETPSKVQYGPPLGLAEFEQISREIPIPVFAIGGLKPENTSSVLHAGAKGVALISGILAAQNIRQATREYLSVIQGALGHERTLRADG